MKKFMEGWTRHSIAVPNLTRTVDCFAKAPEWTKAKPKAVMVHYEELVHINDVYRRKVKGLEGKILWHRGAKVGVA